MDPNMARKIFGAPSIQARSTVAAQYFLAKLLGDFGAHSSSVAGA